MLLYLCLMDKATFVFLVNNSPPIPADFIQGHFCGCDFVHHWIHNMKRGTWNPEISEKDFELRNVHTPEDLFEFLTSRI